MPHTNGRPLDVLHYVQVVHEYTTQVLASIHIHRPLKHSSVQQYEQPLHAAVWAEHVCAGLPLPLHEGVCAS